MNQQGYNEYIEAGHLLVHILSLYSRGKNISEELITDYSGCELHEINWKKLAAIAMDQGLGAMLFKAINGLELPSEIVQKLEFYYQKALYACALRNETLSRISNVLENEGIDFLLLKGSVMQYYYPSPELRVMSDIDFMVKESDRKKVNSILLENDIKFVEANSYQDIYHSANDVIIEVHHALWGYELEKTDLYKNIWSPSNLAENKKHTYFLNDNDLYIFTIAHMLKHFRDSGVGIRPLFDLWYILKKSISQMDFPYIKSQLSFLEATDFEKQIRNLLNCIFLDKEKNSNALLIEDYLLRCKTHGVEKISNANNQQDTSKTEFVTKKLFPPLKTMKRRFSILNKIPFLLPFLWIYRIILLPFKKNSFSRNLNKVTQTDNETKEYVKKVFTAAGIKSKNSKTKSRKKVTYNFIIFSSIIVFLGLVFCMIYFQNDNFGIFENEQSSSGYDSSSDDSSEVASEDLPDTNSSTDDNDDKVYGTISWKGGRYTGYLINNIPNGSGEHIVENSFSYVGFFVNGDYEGQGKITYTNGICYEGEFKDNQANGTGTLYCENGDIINGTFSNGQPGGFCNYEYSDGNLFIGTMINGLKHGEGTFYWLNGDKYVGSYIDDMRDGYGVLYYANGDTYTGNWSQGFCNGYGTYTWSNGKKYEGNFEIGIMNDTNCTIYYPDGSTFKGEITDGIQNGKGELTYSNGDIAKGNFVSGLLSGEADFYFYEKKLWIKVIYEKGVITKYILK